MTANVLLFILIRIHDWQQLPNSRFFCLLKQILVLNHCWSLLASSECWLTYVALFPDLFTIAHGVEFVILALSPSLVLINLTMPEMPLRSLTFRSIRGQMSCFMLGAFSNLFQVPGSQYKLGRFCTSLCHAHTEALNKPINCTSGMFSGFG